MMWVLVSMGVLNVVTVVLTYFFLKRKYSRVQLSEINSLLTDILEVTFKNNSLSSSAESILVVLKRFYDIDYVTIFLYREETGNLSVIASNIGNEYIRGIEKYANAVLNEMRGKAAKVITSDKVLGYVTARERNVRFSNFTKLEFSGRLIGAILLENRDNNLFMGDKDSRLSLYDKVFSSTALVLQNVLYTEKLLRLTSMDQLTGVYNRRFIDVTLPEQLNLHRNIGEECVIVLFDIDFFKKFNDTYGHQFGDVVLKEVSSFVRSNLDDNSWIARYGGEEFLIFLGRTKESDAKRNLEDLRRGIESLELRYGDVLAGVTASFGAVVYRGEGNYASLVEKADKALYKSKENGRNRVTFY